MQSVANATGRPSSSATFAATGFRLYFGFDLSLRPAEMRREDHRRALLERVPNRRQRRANARVVGDDAVLERDVEVHADEHTAPRQIEISDREFHVSIDSRLSD